MLAAPGVFPFDPNTLLKNPGFDALVGAVAFLALPYVTSGAGAGSSFLNAGIAASLRFSSRPLFIGLPCPWDVSARFWYRVFGARLLCSRCRFRVFGDGVLMSAVYTPFGVSGRCRLGPTGTVGVGAAS